MDRIGTPAVAAPAQRAQMAQAQAQAQAVQRGQAGQQVQAQGEPAQRVQRAPVQTTTTTNRGPRSEEEINREILSSFIDKPEFQDFEKGRAKAVQEMNVKYAALIKAEQEIQGDIDGFNNEMSNLLNLKDAHKQPFDLTSIQLEKLDNAGTNPESLPTTKPDKRSTQYFSVLKCGSGKCNGVHRLMAVYQFDNENKITDESFKGIPDFSNLEHESCKLPLMWINGDFHSVFVFCLANFKNNLHFQYKTKQNIYQRKIYKEN